MVSFIHIAFIFLFFIFYIVLDFVIHLNETAMGLLFLPFHGHIVGMLYLGLETSRWVLELWLVH